MSIRKNSAPGGATTSSTTTASNQQSKGALPFTTPGRGGATKLRSAPIIFNNAPLIKSTVTFALANGLGWIISLATGSHVHLDLLGTGAFAVAGLSSILGDTGGVLNSVQLSGGMMTLWGAKLAGFLFFRALQVGHDKRLEETLSSFSGISELCSS
jgi:steroid 5-alpha reductase family enzyme